MGPGHSHERTEMDTSAFGVEHEISKAAELGSPAEAHLMAHDAGWHADKPHRMCERCMNPITQRRAAIKLAARLKKAL